MRRRDPSHQLTITPPNTPANHGHQNRQSYDYERVHSPLRSLSLETASLRAGIESDDARGRGRKFDPVVGSPSRLVPSSTNSFSPFSNQTTFTSPFTTPDASNQHSWSSNLISNKGSRVDYRRAVNTRSEVVEDDIEEEGSRYVLVQNLPADATRNDLENLVVSFFHSLLLHQRC